jgi:cytochrome c-type biogenesis protein CcmE
VVGKSQRLAVFAVLAVLLSGGGFLVLSALQDNIILFFTPSELTAEKMKARHLRIGGLVEDGSINIDGLQVRFSITDSLDVVNVTYIGALPDLFREGQGIIVQGRFEGDIFRAENVLAKHDETYMPREVAESLKEQGFWQGESSK